MAGTAPTGYTAPKQDWTAGVDNPTDTHFNRIELNVKAIEENSRTIDPTVAPGGLTGSLRNFLDYFSYMIKAITGKAAWYTAPAITLEATKTHVDNTTTAHGINTIVTELSDDTTPVLGGNLDRNNKTIHGTLYDNGNSGAAKTVNWSTQGNTQKINISEASTLTFTAPPAPAALLLQVTYGGNYAITWPATVRWPGNTAPTQTKATGKIDVFTFIWNGTYYIGGYSLNYTNS